MSSGGASRRKQKPVSLAGDRFAPYRRSVRSDARSLSEELAVPCFVAGIVPICLLAAADTLFLNSDTTNLYYLQALIGPPLIALLFLPRFRQRTVWVAAGGVLVAILIMLALYVVLAIVLSSGES